MKIPHLASLSATAALLLHFGNFVHANPMFVEINPNTSHSNDASDPGCDDIRITYPAGEGISFDNNTNHVVAWNVPSSYSQVNLTLVGEDSTTYLNTFPSQKGAANIPFVLANGAKPGEYKVQLATIGNSNPCQVQSVPFQIEATEINETTEQEQHQNQNDQPHNDDDHWNEMLSELGQYVDKDHDNADNNSKMSHNKPAPKEEDDETTSAFDNYIKSLDMEYKPYINNNKDTETDVVTHKNSMEEDLEQPTTTQNQQHQNEPSSSSSDDDKKKYFTNEDHRTHTNAHLDAELDQITRQNGEHDNSPFFQGNGGEQSVKKASPNNNNEGDDDDWVMEELPAPVNEWVDESADIKGHSNEAQWMEEEVDPSAIHHPNDKLWSEIEEQESTSSKQPFDHSNAGAWIAEEIEDKPEKVSVHANLAPSGWVAEEDASYHSDGLPDHSNVGEWQAEEVEFDHDENSHPNKVVNGWTEEISPKHPNKVVNGWTEETSSKHSNKVVNGWTEETSSKHSNKVVNGWTEETSSKHSNKVVNGWTEETSSKHSNKVVNGWTEETSSKHPNKVVNGWTEETSSKHSNKVVNGWTEEMSPKHSNKVVNGWTESTSSEHSDKVVNGWTESTSEHLDKVVNGWKQEESTHGNKAINDWQEVSDSSPAATKDNVHLDDNVLIYSAEELIN